MLRGAIVGFGKIARTAHMPAFLSTNISSIAKIAAVCDLDNSLRNIIDQDYPGIKYYYELDELLNSEHLDFIDICLPPVFHLTAIEKAVLCCNHILCEKPLAHSLSDAGKIELLIKRHKIKFSVCYQYKYSPIWIKFKEFTQEHKSASGLFLQFNVFRTNADVGYFKNNPGWRTTKEISGGGILSDTGAHYIYLSNWLLGKPLNVSVVNTSLKYPRLDVEDTSLVTLEYDKGIVQINLTWASDHRENYARISSDTGSLTYVNNSLIKNESGQITQIAVPDASDKSTYITLYEKLFKDFLQKIVTNTENYDLLDEAFETSRILDTCYLAANENRHTAAIIP